MKKYLIFLPLLLIAPTALASRTLPGSFRMDADCQTIPCSQPGTHKDYVSTSTENYDSITFATTSFSGQRASSYGWEADVYDASSSVYVATSTNTISACYPTGCTRTFTLGNAFASQIGHTYKIYMYNRGDLNNLWKTTTQTSQVILNDAPIAETYDQRLVYPPNSTSTFIHDFNYFTFTANSLASSTQWINFKVVYDTTSTFDANPVSVSRNVSYGFAPYVAHWLNIPKPEILASSTTYYAKLCSLKSTEQDWLCTGTTTFKTGGILAGQQINTEQAGWYDSSTAEVNIMYPTSTTDITSETGFACGTEFYNPANWACWGAQRVVLLFNELKDFAVGTFEMGFDFFRQTFPINILSQLSTDLNSVRYSTTTISNISFTGQGTAFKRASGGYYTFTFLTSSTLQASETRVGWNWEQIIVYLLWAMTGIIIVGSAFALIKHAGHNSTPHA